MADKDFKTIDEQIEILRSRGLTIEDEAEAKDFLLRNNYYRVSGYSLTLRKNDVFAKSATFQNIEDIYNFDHEFRHIILHHIETIEVQMKSIYAYEFTKVYPCCLLVRLFYDSFYVAHSTSCSCPIPSGVLAFLGALVSWQALPQKGIFACSRL